MVFQQHLFILSFYLISISPNLLGLAYLLPTHKQDTPLNPPSLSPPWCLCVKFKCNIRLHNILFHSGLQASKWTSSSDNLQISWLCVISHSEAQVMVGVQVVRYNKKSWASRINSSTLPWGWTICSNLLRRAPAIAFADIIMVAISSSHARAITNFSFLTIFTELKLNDQLLYDILALFHVIYKSVTSFGNYFSQREWILHRLSLI